jgi:GntR family transcriptional regulator, transcriptional repressor for pyruvate dehydrogenase complex
MEQIKDAMASGALRRGDRLPPEPEFAQQLKVSRASLREVLKVLASLGILEIRRGSGTFIAKKPKQQMADSLLFLLLLEDGTQEQLVELRYVMEAAFTRLAQQRVQPHHLEALEQNIAALEAAISRDEVTVDLDIAFHRTVLEVTGNPFVMQVGTSIFELFRESMARGVRANSMAAVEHHRAIVEALRSGDPMRVDDAITTSYVFWKALVGGETDGSAERGDDGGTTPAAVEKCATTVTP